MTSRVFIISRYATLLLSLILCVPALAGDNASTNPWYEVDPGGSVNLHFYFFRSRTCPHCNEAIPYIRDLASSMDYVILHEASLSNNPEAVLRYQQLATASGHTARAVPAFLFCDHMITGFAAATTPDYLRDSLEQCRQHVASMGSLEGLELPPMGLIVMLPWLGAIDTREADSMWIITTGLAALDAFNPCAFFVLMFLMSLMLHTGSRGRMLLVGGVFVIISGLMYFLFMAAWLNLFRAIGQMQLITTVAGGIALVVAVINIKDFFWFKKGISLSISDQARPGLYQRMRGLLQAQALLPLLFATVMLALFANMYEFLCTAGFPVVYTRILTLNDYPAVTYYLYLALYNVIYIVPLLVIVLLFAFTMGGRKLQEKEGRRLKLISGCMMLVLGLVLIINPAWLQNIVIAIIALSAAVLLALVMIGVDRLWHQRSTPGPGE